MIRLRLAGVKPNSEAIRIMISACRFAIDTYGDHRMAMAFALVGARWPGVSIREPACVAKTYPGYFDDLRAWGVGVSAA